MSQESVPGTGKVTLDETFKAMQYWRTHKYEYNGPGIPNTVWFMIFQLEDNGYSSAEIKKLFTLNTVQYQKKKDELFQARIQGQVSASQKESQPKQASGVDFCEARIMPDRPQDIPPLTEAAHNTKKAISHLKSTSNKPETYLDLTTIIVECIRPDGHRLKIHTTNESIDKVMQAFYNQGVIK